MNRYPSKVVYEFRVDSDGTFVARAWILPDDYELPDRPPTRETIIPPAVSRDMMAVLDRAVDL